MIMLEIWELPSPSQRVRGLFFTGPAGTAQDVALINGAAYVAASGEGLKIYRVASAPVPEATLNDNFTGARTAVDGNLAVVAGHNLITDRAQLKTVNISNPAATFVLWDGDIDTTYYTFNDVALHVKMSTTDKTMAVVAAAYDGILVVNLTYLKHPP